MIVSVYKSVYNAEPININIFEVYEKIKNPKQKDLITHIRGLKDEGEQKKKKLQLPAVVFSGTFSEARREENWVEHSGRAILDFDECNIEEVRNQLMSLPYIEAVFISPRGNGIKAVAKIPQDKDNFRNYYNALLMALSFANPDPANSDPSRACFISYDPDIYVNKEATIFNQMIDKSKYDILNTATKMVKNAANGERHTTLLKAAKLLGGYIATNQLTEEEAFQTLYEEIMLREPADEREWVKCIEDGLKYGKNAPINRLITVDKVKTVYQDSAGWRLLPISKFKDEYVKAKLPDSNPITLTFDTFDERMRNKYRGKVCAMIGYGGTKKSLFAQNMAFINAAKGKRVIYSQMEMGAPEQIDRFVNMLFDCEGEQMSEWIVKQEVREQGYIHKWYDERLSKQDADRLLFSDSSSLQGSHYREMIEHAKLEYGEVDMLFIDGLSMMGGNPTESETERYSRHTKELKEIANHYNIFIGLICHVSRGHTRHKRDVADKVRGSEKILDNIDFVLNFSLIPEDYDSENFVYRNDIGWIRLWDKRGGGGTYDSIYDFDPMRMRMKENKSNPKDYESTKGKVPF